MKKKVKICVVLQRMLCIFSGICVAGVKSVEVIHVSAADDRNWWMLDEDGGVMLDNQRGMFENVGHVVGYVC